MAQVLPTTAVVPQSPLLVVFGIVYIVLSALLSHVYTQTLSLSANNDLWWPQYNVSGHEAFLADVSNALLMAHSSTYTADLLSLRTRKTYVDANATTTLYPTYARELVLHELTSLSYAIDNLRTLSASWALQVSTQWCYVDFERHFALAHTAARQARCDIKYARNAAVYVEATLRNLVWADFIGAWGGQGNVFTVALEAGLAASSRGQRWLEITSRARGSTSVEAELAYWQSFALTSFTLQWQNLQQTGITESMAIRNAMGIPHTFRIKSLDHWPGPGTSVNLFWGAINDLWSLTLLNASLLAGAPNDFRNANISLESINGNMNADGDFAAPSATLRAHLGPFVSIDAFLIGVPRSLRAAYVALAGDATSSPAIALQVQPKAWAKATFYTGSPLCVQGPSATTFAQRPFSFDDSCSTLPQPLTVALTRQGAQFAHSMTSTPPPHDLCLGQPPECVQVLQTAQSTSTIHALLRQNATTETAALNISLVQIATDADGAWQLLQQGILADNDPSSWPQFYGWLLLHDWILGSREVVSFEGDAGTLVLISNAYEPVQYATSSGSMEGATMHVWHLLAALNFLYVVVAAAVLVYMTRGRFTGANAFFFNRIVGSVWIGRPFSYLRGLSAIALMSTAPLSLVETSSGTSRLVATPRSWAEAALLSGEATWTTYVLQDVLLLVRSPHQARSELPRASLVSFALFLALERAWPVAPSLTLERACYSENIDAFLVCHSGTIDIGSAYRVVLYLAVPLAALVLGACVRRHDVSNVTKYDAHLCGLSRALFRYPSDGTDRAALCMSGILTWRLWDRSYTFDIKTWTFLRLESAKAGPPVDQCVASSDVPVAAPRIFRAIGFVYVVSAITASVSYMQVSAVSLANDLFWPGFNTTGTHVFLASWIQLQLLLYAQPNTTALTAPHVNLPKPFNATAVTIAPPLNYAAKLQHGAFATRLDAIVAGLRALDGCDGPWVFTPYCYLDLTRRWEMANSATRQARCSAMVTNGAIYLETLLRNVDAPSWRTCWGDAFDVAIGSELRQSQAGREWLGSAYLTRSLAIADEVTYWQEHGITYNIVNCYDATYPLTLQAQNGSYRFSSQTSWKMYWALANDLSAVMRNESSLHGLSLLRSSARYGFANQSMEAVLMQSGELTAPFTAGFALVSDILGPFGSVDMIYVSVPSLLQETFADLLECLKTSLAGDAEVQMQFADLVAMPYLAPIPHTTSLSALHMGLPTQFSFSLPCNPVAPFVAALNPTVEQYVVALAMARDIMPSIRDVCDLVPSNAGPCHAYLPPIIAFANDHVLTPLDMRAVRAQVASLSIELLLYAHANTSAATELAHLPLFHASDFDIYAWLFLSDWVLGLREVVSFQGDSNTLTHLSDLQQPMAEQIGSWQLSTNNALYTRAGVLYITCVLLGVAVIVTCYILASRGAFEWLNMFELSRVGGIVWVGRPLLLLRATTALSVLSTATLELLYENNAISAFQTVQNPWYTTLLAASEVTWLVAVVNDVAMALTQAYTAHYATFNSVAVWATVALLSFVSPVTHTVSLQPVCDLVQLDWQIVCASGHIVIGQWSRYVALVTIVVGWNGVCYVSTRLWLRRPPATHGRSVFLSCGAKYLFEHRQWTHGGVYYLDRASAVLTGLLTLRWRRQLYVFDVKLWRIFVATPSGCTQMPGRWRYCIALTEEVLVSHPGWR
ncbi:hypothetical protein SPRG_05947 [Saprolegnia parasitica CBS 223.65]|uniref:Uncharacterized protein n=1 Tax=Saprolegnia parasitica (strain CBS 223.65) TaxID=695850 RepID=A0A067CJN3_SAPPC|nr:hypothetical protein SPRG_05947 [Saprolegnia parasitica CBS 223.65]KDO29410.1 hypothetical protein SPRG_05947 [Saprolegnia parasitica CBS 223.65]|eukprot:XP_012199912.1 hypothetical protein SPRG_05947 [Saprolegnia parasitica CBS 223.65]